MMHVHQQFDEVRVYEGVAERTGNTVHRDSLRRRNSACQSMTELARKVRRDGDGIFYLAANAWPANTEKVDLITKWTPMG